MYVTAGKSLSTLFALLTTVELLSSLAATSWNAESGTQIKNREDNSTNNNEVILTVDPTTNPLGKQHFVFPDHILTFLNATMTAKCMPMMVPMDASHYFNVGNEECATAVIAALEAKFTGYHFIVGVYNGHIKKEYRDISCALVSDCGLESEQSTSNSAIWGLGKYSVASTFVQQLPAAAINDVKGYFVYMTNATRHYQPITAQAAQMAQRNCTDSLASIQKEPQRVLSPLGLVALVEPDNDLQVFTSEGLPPDAFWIGSVLCDTVTGGGATSSSATPRGFHIVLGASQW